jgi:energy-coupling factor transport system permease protein
MNPAFDTRAWLVWVACAAVVAMVARNPLYSVLLLTSSVVVDYGHALPEGAFSLALDWRTMLRIGLLVLFFSGLFNALFVHAGDTVLFVIPINVPLIGGDVTIEAFMSGVTNGLVLLTLLAFFLTFNRVETADRLARLAPPAFRDLGIVMLVALTYIPETTRHVNRIREAQAVRGHRIRGIRDWRPLLIPLLVGGLERAMGLAESMVARGFGATSRAQLSTKVVGGLALAMGLVLGGWVVALWWQWPGWLMVGTGILLVVTLTWSTGRSLQLTRYRERPWKIRDSLLVMLSVTPVVLVLLPHPYLQKSSLSVDFLSGLQAPPFDPLIGSLMIFYAFPVVVGAVWGATPEESRP